MSNGPRVGSLLPCEAGGQKGPLTAQVICVDPRLMRSSMSLLQKAQTRTLPFRAHAFAAIDHVDVLHGASEPRGSCGFRGNLFHQSTLVLAGHPGPHSTRLTRM